MSYFKKRLRLDNATKNDLNVGEHSFISPAQIEWIEFRLEIENN